MLKVLWFNGRKNSKSYWLCECDCGMFKSTRADSLIGGRIKSCGCILKNTTHNMSRSSEYRSFQTAKDRCTNPNNPYYYNYGGRGIEFKFSNFEEFYQEVGDKPNSNFSIERIDNDGNYEKGNIKWATRKEQLENRRNSRVVEYKGETKPLIEWCSTYRVNYNTALRRLYKYGLCADCTFTRQAIKAKKIHCEHKEDK